MLISVNPKLPMRNKAVTRDYYITRLGFRDIGTEDFEDYLILQKDTIEIHFFKFEDIDPLNNYGQIYIRTNDIENLYQLIIQSGVNVHPNGQLMTKPWQQKEFSLLDPDHNLLTFGEKINPIAI